MEKTSPSVGLANIDAEALWEHYGRQISQWIQPSDAEKQILFRNRQSSLQQFAVSSCPNEFAIERCRYIGLLLQNRLAEYGAKVW